MVSADLWNTIAGVFRLQGGAFVQAASLSHEAIVVGVVIVLLAGLSDAVAQSIVLFANRVKPARFFFSWAIEAFLFTFGYLFLVASTWVICRLPGLPHLPFAELALVLAFSYVPLLFSFLGALPYLGPGVLAIVRIWHLLAMVVGVAAIAGVDFFAAATYVTLGWIVMILAQRSFGKPIAEFGTRILNTVSGVRLVSDEQLLVGRVQAAAGPAQQRGGDSLMGVNPHAPARPNAWKIALGLCAVAFLAFVVAIALDPVRKLAFGWEHHLPAVAQVPIDLFWLGLLAIIVSALMAPLETLGWWAGWYGDHIDTTADTAPSDEKPASDVDRFVIYLDGIAQSSSQYTPDIEGFLDALAPELPARARLIRGVMCYSVMNRPLDDDPLFSRFWRFIDALRVKKVDALLGMIINLRNVLIVAVSADSRYGPMYNFGIAHVMYKALIANGYQLGSGIPVTLIGYSGGGQMACASAQVLKHAIDAPVDVISLGGVISGNDPILDLEHLHHFVGDRDKIERIGPVMFPSRWKIAVLSQWNRAKRLGRLTEISLGPVGHQVPGGMLDPNEKLPDGRTNLRQTLDYVDAILAGRLSSDDPHLQKKPSNYERYIAAPWNRPEYYPVSDKAPVNYRPVADWIGRLILPKREERFGGAWFEVHQAPRAYAHLAGAIVKLMWNERAPTVRKLLRATRRDVSFSAEASYTSTYGGFVHPVRLNRWRLVDPLESLAGSHPIDDVVVMLAGTVVVEGDGDANVIRIEQQPVQITGRYYGLARILGPEESHAGSDRYRVAHFDVTTRDFTGEEEVVRLPPVVDDLDGRAPSRSDDIEKSPLNADGWYIYGAPDADGAFVVQSLAPRALLRVNARSELQNGAAYRYVHRQAWRDLVAAKNDVVSVKSVEPEWKPGDTALLLHTYGGIGGEQREATASGPLYFGHFAYGIARVILDPVAGEPRFEIVYYQVYTSNPDGLIPGALHWSRYLGDRQFGWAGLRPVCDTLLRLDTLAEVLDPLLMQLEAMTARYRIGDGTGGTYVGVANNCAQDSNRALFAALRGLRPARHTRLHKLTSGLRSKLQPFGAPRRDWSSNEYNLGSTMEDEPLQSLVTGLGSWRCILPRFANDTVAGVLLGDGAAAWVLGCDQIGGSRPEIRPVVPMTLL